MVYAEEVLEAVRVGMETSLGDERCSEKVHLAALRVLGTCGRGRAASEAGARAGTGAAATGAGIKDMTLAKRTLGMMAAHANDSSCQAGGCVVLHRMLPRVGKAFLLGLGAPTLVAKAVHLLQQREYSRIPSAIQDLFGTHS